MYAIYWFTLAVVLIHGKEIPPLLLIASSRDYVTTKVKLQKGFCYVTKLLIMYRPVFSLLYELVNKSKKNQLSFFEQNILIINYNCNNSTSFTCIIGLRTHAHAHTHIHTQTHTHTHIHTYTHTYMYIYMYICI